MAMIKSRLTGHVWPDPRPLAWPFATHGVRLAAGNRVRTALHVVRHEALKEGSYLVPARKFIGIGWMRAFAEKAVEPGWRDGTSLVTLLEGQLQAGKVVFPHYQVLMTDAFLAHALVLGWIVMLGQLVAGLAIVSGSLTTAALLGGIFMNLNFLLAGVPDPSAFYIVIQAVLVVAGTGAILGADARLATRLRYPLLAARPPSLPPRLSIATPAAVALAMLAFGCAVYAALHIRDWTPSGSVHDPAAVLAVLAFMVASWAMIAALRSAHQPPAVEALRGAVRDNPTGQLPGVEP
jgi:thiosulfate dehydrogenase (quinone) large subunit